MNLNGAVGTTKRTKDTKGGDHEAGRASAVRGVQLPAMTVFVLFVCFVVRKIG